MNDNKNKFENPYIYDYSNFEEYTPLENFKNKYKEVGHYFYRVLNVNAYEYSELMYYSFKNYCELGIPWYDYKDCLDYIKDYNQYKLECDKYVSYRINPLADLLVVYTKDSSPDKKVLIEIHPIESIKITLPKIKGFTAKEVYACLSYIFILDKRMINLKNMHTSKPLTSLAEFYKYETLFNSDKITKMWDTDKINHSSFMDSEVCFMAMKNLVLENGSIEKVPAFYWNFIRNELDAKAIGVESKDVDWTDVSIQLLSDTLPKEIDFEQTPNGFEHIAYKKTPSHVFEDKFERNRPSSNVKTVPSYYDASKDLRKNTKGLKSFYNFDNFNSPLGESIDQNKSGINLRNKQAAKNFTVYNNTNIEKEEILEQQQNEEPKKPVKLNWKEPKNDKRTYNNIGNVLTSKKEDRE